MRWNGNAYLKAHDDSRTGTTFILLLLQSQDGRQNHDGSENPFSSGIVNPTYINSGHNFFFAQPGVYNVNLSIQQWIVDSPVETPGRNNLHSEISSSPRAAHVNTVNSRTVTSNNTAFLQGNTGFLTPEQLRSIHLLQPSLNQGQLSATPAVGNGETHPGGSTEQGTTNAENK